MILPINLKVMDYVCCNAAANVLQRITNLHMLYFVSRAAAINIVIGCVDHTAIILLQLVILWTLYAEMLQKMCCSASTISKCSFICSGQLQ